MSAYNGSDYILEQIDSICRQSVPPAEIIVLDDCSTDETPELILSASKNSSIPIKLFINSENLGFRDSFLEAAVLASSDWICFCDQDDIWRYDKIEKIHQIILRSPEILLISHSASLIDIDSFVIPGHCGIRDRSRYNLLSADSLLCVPGFTLTFHSSLLQIAHVFKQIPDYFVDQSKDIKCLISHDKLIPLVANIYGSQYHINKHLAYYRQHSNNTSGGHKPLTLSERVKKSRKVSPSFYFSQVKSVLAITHILESLMNEDISHCDSLNSLDLSLIKTQSAYNHYRIVAKSLLARYLLHYDYTNSSTKIMLNAIIYRITHPLALNPRSIKLSLQSLFKDILLLLNRLLFAK